MENKKWTHTKNKTKETNNKNWYQDEELVYQIIFVISWSALVLNRERKEGRKKEKKNNNHSHFYNWILRQIESPGEQITTKIFRPKGGKNRLAKNHSSFRIRKKNW